MLLSKNFINVVVYHQPNWILIFSEVCILLWSKRYDFVPQCIISTHMNAFGTTSQMLKI